ncbi:MAG: hypothetical protein FWF01_03815 [Alphaproteobacteria bacterium]|nr:hypothetical protein [Alphaproteobacteria bacterium]
MVEKIFTWEGMLLYEKPNRTTEALGSAVGKTQNGAVAAGVADTQAKTAQGNETGPKNRVLGV